MANRGSFKRRPSRVRQMTPVEAAWVGAMVEGEGSLYLHKASRNFHLAVGNTEVETISTLLRFTNDGTVYCQRPAEKNVRRKILWIWSVTAQEAITDILRQVIPYLTGKQEHAIEVMKEVHR